MFQHLVPVLTVAIAATTGAAAQDAPNMDELRSHFESAFNAGNAGEVARRYAEDATLHPPNADKIEGRAGVEGYFADFIEQRQASQLEITSGEDRQIGNAYLDTGTYSMTATGPDGQEVQVTGDYASLVEQSDGEWLVTRHIWNQDMPK